MNDANRLLGSWTLVSWTRTAADGAISHPHTEAGAGRLIYSPQGRMCGFLMAPDHARGARNDANPLFVGYSARFEVIDGVANHHVDFASDVRMLAKVLRRRIEWVSDDVIRLHTLAAVGAADRDSSHQLTWRRDATS